MTYCFARAIKMETLLLSNLLLLKKISDRKTIKINVVGHGCHLSATVILSEIYNHNRNCNLVIVKNFFMTLLLEISFQNHRKIDAAVLICYYFHKKSHQNLERIVRDFSRLSECRKFAGRKSKIVTIVNVIKK